MLHRKFLEIIDDLGELGNDEVQCITEEYQIGII
jgi:hypothetical protein